MQSIAEVYYLNGSFLVFDNEHALALRKKRIFGQHIGCSPKNPHQVVQSGLPCHINHYAANIILENKLAVFKRMIPHENVSIENNKSLFAMKLSEFQENAKKEFLEKRTDELKKRRIEVSSDRIGKFDDKKVKIDISNKPELIYSSVYFNIMNENEVANCFVHVASDKLVVFRDLYKRGFYLSMGMKFGCDFLAYQGDPVRYHAKYAIRLTANKGGQVDLVQEKYNELNALHRLCHTAKKTLALATIILSDDNKQEIKYWTLKTRDYIKPDSGPDVFDTLDL